MIDGEEFYYDVVHHTLRKDEINPIPSHSSDKSSPNKDENSAHLIIKENNHKYFIGDNQIIRIGSGEKNHIQLSHPSIKKLHAVISINNGKYSIRKLNSDGRILKNKVPISGNQEIEEGNVITLGEIDIIFHSDKNHCSDE